MRFNVYVDGVDRPARPYTSPRMVEYPAPVGPRRGYVFPFSDQVLYPRTMGARTVVTRLSVAPPRMSRLLALLARTGSTRLVAMPRVRAALGRLRQHGPAAPADRAVLAAGRRRLPRQRRARHFDRHRPGVRHGHRHRCAGPLAGLR